MTPFYLPLMRPLRSLLLLAMALAAPIALAQNTPPPIEPNGAPAPAPGINPTTTTQGVAPSLTPPPAPGQPTVITPSNAIETLYETAPVPKARSASTPG